jgi:hypothetical protein
MGGDVSRMAIQVAFEKWYDFRPQLDRRYRDHLELHFGRIVMKGESPRA